ncbi:hypothetical protein [Frigoribacterium sp. VKM Ac-2836]|uniref:hypothetical protein n=1 Tax=Frigoribacterium sp. VKM Ac-2836 TaxID=2739014 RepID=UPI001564DA56|nr:hypothetical protein [Frigoribacterium sp. VKM Ac-2836]NRD26935.1 hypothetical protein [Frigoribacterium sp. VKM Ac-2836]
MKAREIAREAVRDVVSGTTMTLLWVALFVLAVGGVAASQAVSLRSAVDEADRWTSSGAATLVESAEGRIDGHACDSLVALPTVRAAGAIRSSPTDLVAAALPRAGVPTHVTTPGFAALLSLDGTADGLGPVVSDEAARAVGLTGPGLLATPGGTVPVQGVFRYPDDGRDPSLAYSALSVTQVDDGPFDACWATSWPADDEAVAALGRTLLPDSGAETSAHPTLGQLNSTLGSTFRPGPVALGGWGPAVASGLGLALGAASTWRRRSSLASDRHIGVSVLAQAGSQLVQAAVWTTAATLWTAALVLTVTAGLRPGDAVPIDLDAARTVALGVVGVIIGLVLGVASIREASLLRYVRDR